jgi:hypothetical protein
MTTQEKGRFIRTHQAVLDALLASTVEPADEWQRTGSIKYRQDCIRILNAFPGEPQTVREMRGKVAA